jgi:CHAD domain-containing protein
MTTETAETELKLDVDLDFALPDLAGLAEGVIDRELPRVELVATYFDTPDRRLLRHGITLRHRRDRVNPDGEHQWTLKLPTGTAKAVLERTELSWPGPVSEIPEEARRVLRGIVRHAELQQVAQLITSRRRVELTGSTGCPLAEIDDDTVAVMDGLKLSQQFREVEVELKAGDETLLDRVVERLIAAGASANADQRPKVARALGEVPSWPSRPPLRRDHGHDVSFATLVAATLSSDLDRLLAHDPGLRLAGDPEHVHQARVAIRRLRSDLKAFSDDLDPSSTTRLRSQLAHVGLTLGDVRDADVLLARLETQGRDVLVDDDHAGLEELTGLLRQQRRQDYTRLLDTLASDSYLTLLDELTDASVAPPWATEPVDQPADQAMGRIVRRTWKKLQRAVRTMDNPTSDQLHRVRIMAKQLRYSAEAAAAVVGKPARRLAKAAAELQGVLGDHHDAVSAEGWLRQAARTTQRSEAPFVAGELTLVQRQQQRELSREWRPVWRYVKAKRLRRWL